MLPTQIVKDRGVQQGIAPSSTWLLLAHKDSFKPLRANALSASSPFPCLLRGCFRSKAPRFTACRPLAGPFWRSNGLHPCGCSRETRKLGDWIFRQGPRFSTHPHGNPVREIQRVRFSDRRPDQATLPGCPLPEETPFGLSPAASCCPLPEMRAIPPAVSTTKRFHRRIC